MTKRTNRVSWALCGLLFGTALVGSASQARKLYPVDEGPKDRSFLAFRYRLIDAAKKRDARFLLSHLDPHIVTDPFAEPPLGKGIKEFKEEWHPEDPKSQLWKELVVILSLGGSFKRGGVLQRGKAPSRREFVAPYVTSQWPDSLFDVEKYQAIIGKHVPVRRRPNATAPVIDRVSNDILKVDWKASEDNHWDWVKVTTPRGKRGYVAGYQIRSAGDNEAHFIKVKGKWVMNALFATDGE